MRFAQCSLAFVLGFFAMVGWPAAAEAQCLTKQTGQLLAANGAAGDSNASSVDVFGDVLALGAPYRGAGSVYVYRRDPTGVGWTLVTELTAPGGSSEARFGYSVALYEDTLFVGAPEDGPTGVQGALYVYGRDEGGPGQWGLVQELPGEGNSLLGWSVDVWKGRAIGGAPNQTNGNGTAAGAIYFYLRDPASGQWSQTEEFLGAAGFDWMGGSVAITDGYAIAGGWNDYPRIYWIPPGKSAWELKKQVAIEARFIGSGYAFGNSFLDIRGDLALIGSPADDLNLSKGAAYLLERNQGAPNGWGVKKKLQMQTPYDAFGFSVALSDEAALIGSPRTWQAPPFLAFPYAFVYERSPGWKQTAALVPGNVLTFDLFGFDVALDGAVGVVGSPRDDDLGANSGSAYVYMSIQSQVLDLCASGTSGAGCQATMTASGVPSPSQATGFELRVSGVDGQRNGLLYWGRAADQTAQWGNGTSYQCVTPPVVRTPLQASGGTAGACDGSLVLDFNAWMVANPSKAPLAGELVHVQAWYRDPLNSSNQKSVLTQGVRFALCP